MKSLIKKILKEEDDLKWMKDIPVAIVYRFFDIYVCYESEFDEGRDEYFCHDGYSAFIKIPEDTADERWDGYVGYQTDSDEGRDVIEYAIEHNLFDPEDADHIEYVREVDGVEYNHATGREMGRFDGVSFTP